MLTALGLHDQAKLIFRLAIKVNVIFLKSKEEEQQSCLLQKRIGPKIRIPTETQEFLLGCFPFVRTECPDNSFRKEHFTFSQNCPNRSVDFYDNMHF